MILTTSESFITILIIAVLTFLTRAIPFLLFPDHKKAPDMINYLGKVLPYASVGMLIIYCLRDITFKELPYGIPEIVSIVFIIILHRWKRSTLLSIAGGTILYMLIIQWFF